MNLTIDHLRTLVTAARNGLYDNLICAGGAPTDILMNAAVKDIDLFVRPDSEHLLTPDDFDVEEESVFRRKCRSFLRALGDGASIRFLDSGACESGGNLDDVAEITGARIIVADESTEDNELPDAVELELPTIQIMALWTDPVDDVHEYDFFQRQVFVTPGGVFCSKRAIEDHLSGRITYNDIPRTEASMRRSVNRYVRLRAKYHWLQFVGCEKHEAIIAEDKQRAEAMQQALDNIKEIAND